MLLPKQCTNPPPAIVGLVRPNRVLSFWRVRNTHSVVLSELFKLFKVQESYPWLVSTYVITRPNGSPPDIHHIFIP